MLDVMTPLAITAYTATSAIGHGRTAHLDALRTARSGLRPNDFSSVPLACWIGRVDGVEDVALPAALDVWACRNNQLAWLGLNQDGFLDRVQAARERYGAGRIALLLGTSTASIGATEEAYRRLDADGGFAEDMLRPAIHAPHSLAAFVAAPHSALEQRERLEQLRALAIGLTIAVAVVDTVPLGVDTQADLDRARSILEGGAILEKTT